MNTTEILKSPTPSPSTKRLVGLKRSKQLLAVSVGAFVVFCAASIANAQQGLVYSVNIVGCVPERTAYLLTAPLTPLQRQEFHAETFNRLAPSARALYLRVVAYAVGVIVHSEDGVSSAALAEYMQNNFQQNNLVDPVVASPELLAHKAVVKEAMRELNVLIAPQVASNFAYQQAMEAGAVDSIFDEIEDFER